MKQRKKEKKSVIRSMFDIIDQDRAGMAQQRELERMMQAQMGMTQSQVAARMGQAPHGHGGMLGSTAHHSPYSTSWQSDPFGSPAGGPNPYIQDEAAPPSGIYAGVKLQKVDGKYIVTVGVNASGYPVTSVESKEEFVKFFEGVWDKAIADMVKNRLEGKKEAPDPVPTYFLRNPHWPAHVVQDPNTGKMLDRKVLKGVMKPGDVVGHTYKITLE